MAPEVRQPLRSAALVRRSAWRVARFDPSLPDDLAELLWSRPNELITRGEMLRAVGVRRTVGLTWAARRYVLKHYVEPTRRHALKQLMLPSRAWKTWSVSHRLADAGITTPRAVACVENRWGGLRRDSYLLYPYVDGRTLRSYFVGEEASPSDAINGFWNQLRDLWHQLARLRATLGDANLKNFIVSPTGRLWVIDLDKTRFHRLPYFAARHQRIRWKQVLRNAAKC